MPPIYTPKKRQAARSLPPLKIKGLSDEGRGLAEHKGRKVFVEGALPGEEVAVRVLRDQRQFAEAKVQKLISPVPDRVEPVCPVFRQCGGCTVQYMPYEQQIDFKQQALLSQLSRWANICPNQLEKPVTGSPYHYRQRVRLSVNYTRSDEVMLGFREANSQRIVNIDQCPVLLPELSQLLQKLRGWIQALKPKVVSHIELFFSSDVIGVLVRHTRPLPQRDRQCLSDSLPEAECWFQGDKSDALQNNEGDEVDPRLHYALPEYDLRLAFHPKDFIQSNPDINRKMVSQAVEWLAPKATETVLDLFCGIGNFSLPLARRARHVVGVEGVDVMVQRAEANARLNELTNTTFFSQNLADEEWNMAYRLRQLGFESIDSVLLDPPRSGAKEISQQIVKLSPQRIVYVSCSSATFVRDAKILVDGGYQLIRLGTLDMFPQTPHSEVMGLFSL